MTRQLKWTAGIAAVAVVCAFLATVRGQTPAPGGDPQARAPGQSRSDNRLVDNDRVTVMRLTASAGLTEEMHITPQDVVAIQAGPGDIEMQIGRETTKGSQGKVWYLPKTVEHALFNRGREPVDMIVVMLANTSSPTAPATPAQGASPAAAQPSNRVIDNERVSVVRVPAPVGMKQDMHKSPQDMVAVQGTSGQIEVAVGSERTKGGLGKVWYLPKTLDHAVFNTGREPAEMIVIMLK